MSRHKLPAFSGRSTVIERKTFSIDIDPYARGTRVRITETNRDRSFSLSLQWSTLRWLIDSIEPLRTLPLNQKFFKEKRVDNQVFWIEKINSKKGYAIELTRLESNGGKGHIIIPVGEDRKGWEAFRKLITFYSSDGIIPTNPSLTKQSLEGISYKQALQKPSTVNQSTNAKIPTSKENKRLLQTTLHPL